MISSAHAVQLKLESEHILEKAYEGYDVSTEVETCTQYACNLNTNCANAQKYHLVIVGHSTGAGVASLLAILLKRQYPKLQCYAYSPPGGLLW